MSNPSPPRTTPTSTVSTHVLDAARGNPAAGIEVAVTGGPSTAAAQRASTDADGRISFAEALHPGVYTLSFATGPWFAAADRDTFYPAINITISVDPTQPHYHVALLLSPFSYTTYRGS